MSKITLKNGLSNFALIFTHIFMKFMITAYVIILVIIQKSFIMYL